MKTRIFVFLFGGTFGAFGVFMCAMAFHSIWRWVDSSTWISVPAVIDALELEENHGESTTYRVVCAYSYRFNGRRYRGDSPSLYSSSDNIGPFHQQLYERLRAAQAAGKANCLVDPDRPQQSLLDRTFRPGMLAFQMLFMVIFGTIGLTVLSFNLATREPREFDGRLQIDSENRASRFSAQVMILYHGLIVVLVIPVAIVCLTGGNLYALAPFAMAAVSLAAVYFCWRYVFHKQPVAGRLLLPAPSLGEQATATLRLPASWQGPVDMETRWVIPAPPSNRVGVEDETGESTHVQLPAVSGTNNVTEIDLPMPQLPKQLPSDRKIKLEMIGTIGGYRYKDEFAMEAEFDRQ